MKEFYQFCSKGMVCLCLSLCFLSAMPPGSQTLTPRYFSIADNSNGFYESLPPGYSTTGTGYPLIVFNGGQGQYGDGSPSQLSRMVQGDGLPEYIKNGQFPTSVTVNGQTYSFIVIMPQFGTTPSAAQVDQVIQYAISNYNVDVHRVYLTGISDGGGVTAAYPGDNTGYAKKLAAVLTVCGNAGLNDNQIQNIASTNLPFFATHNVNDPTVGSWVTIQNVTNINNYKPTPTVLAVDTLFNAAVHDAWTNTYDPTHNIYKNQLNVYQWMLQYSRGVTAPLPVRMTAYTAMAGADGTEVNVDWTTAMEQNNAYFLVQRSGDGSRFTNLDTVTAAAAPGAGHSYVYTDGAPLAGDNFYRLEQVDLDGKATFYGVLKVTLGTTGKQTLQVSPNPAYDFVNLHLEHPETGTLQISLTDMQGRAVRGWIFAKQGTIWDQQLQLNGLAAGSYVLRIRGTAIREVQTIIKR
jgi:type IX secretion system substrate protein